MKEYIKVAKIYRVLRQAEEEKRVLYIFGVTGFGKTSAVKYYYRNKSHLYLSGAEGFLSKMPSIEHIDQSAVIIDDISWVRDLRSQEYIKELIALEDKHIVLIGRSRLPSWLHIEAVEENFLFASEAELVFQKDEAKKMLEAHNIKLSDNSLDKLLRDSRGHPVTLRYACNHLQNGNDYSLTVIEETQLDLFHYYDKAFYEKWNSEMRDVLLAMCNFETFTIAMAELITGNNRIPVLLDYALQVGSFLTKSDEVTYSCRRHLRVYFQWKQSMLYTKAQIAANYERAALYYELQGDISKALYYYNQANNNEKILDLLVKDATNHPGIAHFFETREYYYRLPVEKVKTSPILMSGMAMLYSVTMQPEQSNYWYEQLDQFNKTTTDTQLRKEARIRLAYLDIALPQKGIHGIIKILRNTAILLANRKIDLPEFSVTSNLPSIMNGGLDFCEWSRNDKELARLMKRPVELVLGQYGVGLVNIAMAESAYEKGTMNNYEIMTRLNSGYMKADTGGKIELCFAATALMIKEHLINGQMAIAQGLLDDFYQKVRLEQANQLLSNMDTFSMWLQLHKGNTEAAKTWLENAPNEMIAFYCLDRYHYINKVRALIVLDRYEEALGLIERLDTYFCLYERNYLWMENQLLKAIVQYRRNDEIWTDTLEMVLLKAKYFKFVRIFTQEGAALKPLLDNYKGIVDEKIRDETNQMAIYYPNYLRGKKKITNILTKTESRVLRLLCQGLTSAEICELCGFSYNSFKFHNKNIYRKLGVNNRTAAEREAIKLGLDGG